MRYGVGSGALSPRCTTSPATASIPLGGRTRPRSRTRCRKQGGGGASPAPRGASDRSRAEQKLGWYLAGPAFAVMLLVTAYPIIQAVYYSLFAVGALLFVITLTINLISIRLVRRFRQVY